MASSKRKRSTRKVKSLKAKSVSGKKAKGVKGGAIYMNYDATKGEATAQGHEQIELNPTEWGMGEGLSRLNRP